jgi:hypothetical protein
MRELARISEGLEIEQDRRRRVVVLPPLEQIVRGDVGFVPDRDEGRKAEVPLDRLLEERQPERTALRREADAPRRQRPWCKRCVQPERRDRNAETIRPDEPCAVRADELEQLLLPAGAFGADFGEAGRDHAERANARPECVARRSEHAVAGDADDDEVDGLRELLHGAIRADAGDARSGAVDGIDGPGEIGFDDVPEKLTADRAAARRSADDSNGRGREERPERRRDGNVITALDTLDERRRLVDRELHVHLTVVERPRHRKPGAREDLEHLRVVGEDLGLELVDPVSRCNRRELLEQPRADAKAMQGVGDGERDLGAARLAQSRVLRDRDDPTVEHPDEHAAAEPLRVHEACDERVVDATEAVESAVEAAI